MTTTTTTTTPAADEPGRMQRHPCACGRPSTTRQTIGGISTLRCAPCTIRDERDDLIDQLGAQYRGIARDRGDHLNGRVHRIAWAQGGGGDYTYQEALERMAQRPGRTIAPADPVVSARAFLETQAMRTWDNSALPNRREHEAALRHIAALLRLVAPEEGREL